MTTREQVEADQARQREEAAQSQEGAVAAGAQDEVLPDTPDSPNPQNDGGAAPQDGEVAEVAEQAEPVKMSPSDEARKRIADRFKVTRGDPAKEVEGEADLRDQSTMYGAHTVATVGDAVELPAEAEKPAAEATEQPTAGLPPKIKLKVRQEEREFTPDEVLALARKAAAGDDYVEEGKEVLKQAKALRDAAARSPQSEDAPASSDELEDDNRPEPPPQADNELEKIVEEIQYGDTKEATKKLGEFIRKAGSEGAQQNDLQKAMNADASRTQAQLQEFFTDEKNTDLSDQTAQRVMIQMGQDEMRADLRKLGLTEDRLPTDPKELAQWHRYYRVTGANVRDVGSITTEVATKFRTWRGVTPSATPKPQNGKPAPRTQQPAVNVNREARRLTVPVQPSRATALPQAPAPATAIIGRRSNAVARMQKARGQIVTS